VTAEQKVSRAAQKAASARDDLDNAIREARTAGLSLRTIAKAAGLSPEWVRKICGESRDPPSAREPDEQHSKPTERIENEPAGRRARGGAGGR
jgi:hypothetical protein